jgi:HK97 family phage prohead protease
MPQAVRYRQRPIRMRALPDVGEGAVEAVVAAYDVVYDVQDWFWETKERIAPGAFADSIAAKPVIPLFWQHDWEGGPIGDARASETSADLRIRGQLYVDDPSVARIWRSMRAEAVEDWSIGYVAVTVQIEHEDDDPKGAEIEAVMKGQLCEASAAVMGANPGTETISVRRAGGRLAKRGLTRSGPGALLLPRSARRRDADVNDDEDPGRCAQAVDAAIDEALDQFAEGNVDQAIALVQAADLSVDTLLDLLGMDDPDEDAEPPAEPTYGGYRSKRRRVRQRGAIAPHSTATSEGAWDAGENEKNLSNDDGEAEYRKAYAWQDPEGDPDKKNAYKFIHHEVAADGTVGAANMTACSTGIGVLNGGRGGADIPDDDVQGVWNHLAKHLRDDGREPPELRALASGLSVAGLSDIEVRRMFDAVRRDLLTEDQAVDALQRAYRPERRR